MNLNNKKGYSLVEMIIYLAIFTAISILVINSFITILSSFNTTHINRKLLESGIVSMERISRSIRGAESATVNSSTDIVLNNIDDATSSFNLRVVGENGQLNLYKNNSLEGNILTPGVSLSSLIFRQITTPESQAIKIEMTIEYTSGHQTKSVNFYNTVILRKSY